MANKRIITNPKFIVERDGNDYVLKFRDGNIYKPIEFNNAQLSGKRNTVIPNPNFSIIANNLYVNVNGINVKIGEVGDGYTLASNVGRSIVEPNLDIVLGYNGSVSVVTEIGGKNITINGGGNEPVYTNRLYYTIVEGGHKPESTWITENCSENVFNETTGEGYLVLNEEVDTIEGSSLIQSNIFDDSGDDQNIVSVVIPSQIIEIGNLAFSGCYLLVSVTIPNTVTVIGEYAFDNCTQLVSIIIPNTITIIEDFSFNECRLLTSITIPSSVLSIGENSFYNCEVLTSVTCKSTTPPQLGNYAFSDINTDECFVPAESITAYQKSDWANYFTTFTAIEGQQEE